MPQFDLCSTEKLARRLSADLSSGVMHEEFTQAAGFDMAQGPQCGLFLSAAVFMILPLWLRPLPFSVCPFVCRAHVSVPSP